MRGTFACGIEEGDGEGGEYISQYLGAEKMHITMGHDEIPPERRQRYGGELERRVCICTVPIAQPGIYTSDLILSVSRLWSFQCYRSIVRS